MFSPDGKNLFFNSMSDENGSVQIHADIWKVDLTNENKPSKIDQINSKYNEGFPKLSVDKTIYFHSNREGNKGGFDIYFSNYINGKYSNPINIGDSINTEYFEFHPCISKDRNFIIFSSLNRLDEIGELDLYISFLKKDGTRTIAKNLGKEINSDANDYMPFVSNDGKYLFSY